MEDGLSPNPPRPTVQSVLQGIDLWSPRVELAIIHEEVPWTDLLAGQSPDAILDDDKMALVQQLRSKGLDLVFMATSTTGWRARARRRNCVRPGAASPSRPCSAWWPRAT